MSGDNREPNASLLNNGLLNKIIFPTKGSVSIVYEPNTYYDAFAENKNSLGPGVRVQKLNFEDSSGSPLKSSSYLFSERNNTSGQLINNPNYAYVKVLDINLFNGNSRYTHRWVDVSNVGEDYFEDLSSDCQDYVMSLPKYKDLDYDTMVELYDDPIEKRNNKELEWFKKQINKNNKGGK